MPYEDRDGKTVDRKYKIAVAYDPEIDTKNNPIYNFFATKVNIPIKWHTHATFELNSDRNTITESVVNQSLLERLATLLAKSAESLNVDDRWGKLGSILPDGDFPTTMNLAGNKFEEIYLSKITGSKILPVYDGGYISIDNKPVLLEEELHKYVTPIDNLLEYATEQKYNDIIQQNTGNHKPSLKLVCSNIKNKLADMSLDDRATIIQLLGVEYDHLNESDFVKNVPSIFIDDNSNPISNGNVYLSPQEKLSTLPGFVRIKTMNVSLQNKLANKLNAHGARSLVQALSSYGVHEYALKPIIDKMNGSLRKSFSSDNYRAYITWLFDNRERLSNEITVLILTHVNL